MARFDMIALFREAALSADNKKFDGLSFETTIGSLGLDSVAMSEIIGYIEDETGAHLDDDEIAKVQTLGELARLVEREAA